MISSAVVIPEPPRETSPPARHFKRKLSQSPSRDSKRARVEVDELQYDEPSSRPTPPSESARPAVHVASADPSLTSPTRRKSSLLSGATATEEKKRNKRLFGGLLGTLSQTTTKPAHKKRDEIEARQRERMRQQTEEEEERRIQKKKDLDHRRREEQRVWDEEAMRQRHRNMRDMAGFLRTKTEPRLYYKPWELRPEEEKEISRQKEDVERLIRRELGQDEEMDHAPVEPRQLEANKMPTNQHETDGPPANGEHPENEGDARDEGTPGKDRDHDNPMEAEGQPLPEAPPHDSLSSNKGIPTTNGTSPQPQTQSIQEEEIAKEDDRQDEELVEGQEDDVIY